MSRVSLDQALAALSLDALDKGVAPEVVDRAVRATRSALGGATDPESHRVPVRVRSYFWAVVRRTVMRQRTGGPIVSRFVIESVIADLASSGRDEASVWAEVVRGWGDRLPGEVLEEYRARVCA